jgi:hypothetical protein
MVTRMVPLRGGVVVRPLAIVDGNLHLSWVAMVQAIAASEVLVAPEILWIVDIRVMLEASIIALTSSSTPSSTVGRCWLLSLCTFHGSDANQSTRDRDYQGFADHHPPQVIRSNLWFLRTPPTSAFGTIGIELLFATTGYSLRPAAGRAGGGGAT